MTGIFAELPTTIGARLQVHRRAQDAFPQIVGRGHRQTHRFALFFRERQHLGEQQLLDGAEQLVRRQIVFARRRAAQHAHVQHHDFRFFFAHPPQRRFQMVQGVIGAHWNQNISGRDAHARGSQLGFRREIELIEFDVRGAGCADAHAVLGNFEDREKQES